MALEYAIEQLRASNEPDDKKHADTLKGILEARGYDIPLALGVIASEETRRPALDTVSVAEIVSMATQFQTKGRNLLLQHLPNELPIWKKAETCRWQSKLPTGERYYTLNYRPSNPPQITLFRVDSKKDRGETANLYTASVDFDIPTQAIKKIFIKGTSRSLQQDIESDTFDSRLAQFLEAEIPDINEVIHNYRIDINLDKELPRIAIRMAGKQGQIIHNSQICFDPGQRTFIRHQTKGGEKKDPLKITPQNFFKLANAMLYIIPAPIIAEV